MFLRFNVALCATRYLGAVVVHALPADAIDTADLKALTAGGLVNEDVLQKIFNISEIPTPFLDLIGTDTCDNSYTEWPQDELGAPSPTNARISGSDPTGVVSATGSRVGNHTQICDPGGAIIVSERARNTDNVGTSDQLTYEVMKGLQKVRRNVESIATGRQASVEDNGNNTAGKSGGFSAWIATNDFLGTGGVSGGFNTTTKVVDAPTAGLDRVLAWSYIQAAILAVYTQNGNPTTLMTNAALTQKINEYLNADTTYKAAQQANVTGTGPGVAQTAQGYYQVIKTDFGFNLEIVPNRLQQTYLSGETAAHQVAVVDLFVIDPSMVAIGYLDGYKVKQLAKTGLSEKRDVTVDWTLKVYQQKAHAVIRDLLPSGTVTD